MRLLNFMKKGKCFASVLLVSMALLFSGAVSASAADAAAQPARTLRVALYPYVPDLQAFKTTLQTQWQKAHPDTALQVVDWDCYVDAPRMDIDVFVFDATYFPAYWRSGVLSPLGKTLPDQKQYPQWLLTAAEKDGVYYGIPQMVCMDMLFYRKGDKALAKVKTMDELYRAVGPRKSDSLLPGPDEGVLTDFSPSSGNPLKYYNILQDHYQALVPQQAMQGVDSHALSYLQHWFAMTGKATGLYASDYEFTRAQWFAAGHGRALYAYPESFHEIVRLGQGDNVDIKTISSCEHPDFATSYVDYVGISAKIPADKKEAAEKMAAMLTSKAYMMAVLRPSDVKETPQYLLSAREDVMKNLAKSDKTYQKIYRKLYKQKNLHVMTGTIDFTNWENKVDPDIEKALDTAGGK